VLAYRRRVLSLAEKLGPDALARLRRAWWRRRMYVYVTPGELLVELALQGFPDDIRTLGRGCRIIRTDARGGGGFYPDRNEVELAAGVETYEGLRQVELSACHELFHYVCWNDPRYRADEDRGFPSLRRAVFESRSQLGAYPKYTSWVRESFLRQGEHANPVEYFADIPTNFRDAADLPPPLRAHFAPLIDGSPMARDLSMPPTWPIDPASGDLATFQRWAGGRE
jgi:hypothetical protein